MNAHGPRKRGGHVVDGHPAVVHGDRRGGDTERGQRRRQSAPGLTGDAVDRYDGERADDGRARPDPGQSCSEQVHPSCGEAEPQARQTGLVPRRGEERDAGAAIITHGLGEGEGFVEVPSPRYLLEKG